MSLGNETVIAAAAAQATSASVQPQARSRPEGGHRKIRESLPYEQRIDLPGKAFIQEHFYEGQGLPSSFVQMHGKLKKSILCWLASIYSFSGRSILLHSFEGSWSTKQEAMPQISHKRCSFPFHPLKMPAKSLILCRHSLGTCRSWGC